MLIVKKNNINLVTEMLWLRQNEEHKIDLQQMKKQGQFNYFCKTNKLMLSYGFVQINITQNIQKIDEETQKVKKKVVTVKNLVSLGLFVINALDISGQVDNMFICFRVSEALIGYVFIYQGTIFVNDGEYIADAESVRLKITEFARVYHIKNIRIFDDVPFYNQTQFFESVGLDNVVIVPSIKEKGSLIRASEYYLWQNKKIKKIISKSLIRKVMWLPHEYRLLLAACGAVFLCSMLIYLKSIYSDFASMQNKAQEYVYINDQGVDAAVLLDKCFFGIDNYLQPLENWRVKDLSCDLKGLTINYLADNGTVNQIKEVIRNPQLVIAVDEKTARLYQAFNLTKLHPKTYPNPLSVRLEQLKAAAKEYSLDVLMKGNSAVEISSTVSPLFLYEHQVINKINIFQITMHVDEIGLFHWVIKGDLDGE